MCLLKILCSGCPFGKHLSRMLRNFLLRLVFPLAFDPWGVVTYDFSLVVSFALWLWVVRELVFVAALVERFLVRQNSIIENFLAR